MERQGSAYSLNPDTLAEVVSIHHSNEVESAVVSETRLTSNPVNPARPGVFGALRSAAAGVGQRVTGPRAPVPPVPPNHVAENQRGG